MLKDHKSLRGLVAAGSILLCVPAAHARQADDQEASPRIERVTFRGADAISEASLQASIVTEETRCRSFLLRPLCAVTDWGLLLDEHHLDREQLELDELRLRVYYHQRGYRQAQVAADVRPRGRGVEVVFTIEEGPPTRIAEFTLEQTAEVLSERRIRRARLPESGDPLDLLQLDQALVDLAGAYGERGYLDAEVRDVIDVAPDGLSATVSVVLEPRRRSTLDTLDVRGNEQIDDTMIAEALQLRLGRILRSNDILASQRSLYDSNLFHEARVRVPEQPDSAKRVEITVREAPPRGARVGGGFNTIEFIQVEGRITHHNLLGGRRRLDVRGTVGNLLAGQLNGRLFFRDVLPPDLPVHDERAFLQPTWQASIDFRQPAFRSAANVLGIGAFAHRLIVPAVAIDEGYGGDVSMTRRFDFPTAATLSYRFEMAGVRAGDLYFCVNYAICVPTTIEALRERNSLSPAGLSFVDDRSDDPIAPTTGHRIRLDVEHASQFTLSDFRYHRISGAGARYMPLDLDRRRVLAGRVRVGWAHPLAGTAGAIGIAGDADRILHPRKRFYSGGARSVRGYRENQLGPRVLTVDPNALREEAGCTDAEIAAGTCDPAGVPVDRFIPRPVGGRSVVEANVEYRFPVGGSFQGAVFVDGAIVGEGLAGFFTRGRRAVTPGFGARWRSPVGPVRVDLGIRPFLREELPVITEIVDDVGERQLVRLETPRRYNPLEDSGGFLQQVLGRLVLHLAIGEAF